MSVFVKIRNYFSIGVLVLLFSVLSQSVMASTMDAGDPTVTVVNKLADADFSEKAELVEGLGRIKDARILPLLKAMLDGNLYYIDATKKVVIVTETEKDARIIDALNESAVEDVSVSDLSKIGANNSLRRLLRSKIAEINLSSDNESVRLKAVSALLGDIDEESAAILGKALPNEPNKKVQELMRLGMAMVDVAGSDKQKTLAAIELLGDSLLPEAQNLIRNTQNNSDDAQIQVAAKKALAKIEKNRTFYSFIETTFFGISLGTVLLLIAVGLAITFGVMGVINMAHGELMMLGAYTTYVIQQLMPDYIGISLFVAIPAAFIVSGLVGILIERGIIRFLYGRPLETLLATFGISLVLQQIVRTIFSPLNRAVETPGWMSGSWMINDALSLTYNRIYIVIFALLVFVGLLLVLKKTKLGLQVRAVSQNRAMARAMGIRTEWVDAMTFGLGSGIAGIAGVALSQLTNVGPNLGQGYIVDSFMVVVFGGVGNLWGTLVGALSLGVINKYLEPWIGAVLAKIFVLLFIILFIQKRPRGLFPQKGRAAEN